MAADESVETKDTIFGGWCSDRVIGELTLEWCVMACLLKNEPTS